VDELLVHLFCFIIIDAMQSDIDIVTENFTQNVAAQLNIKRRFKALDKLNKSPIKKSKMITVRPH
jgi:hypothetical protein